MMHQPLERAEARRRAGGLALVIVRQGALLLLVAGLAAFGAARFRPAPNTPALDEGEISVEMARAAAMESLFVDARPAAAFAQRHIPGAVSLPEGDWERQLPVFVARWTPDRRVIVYCDNPQCGASRSVARRLREEVGVPDVVALRGGWVAWLAANGP